LEASAARPPAASARRHRFADIRDTRNRFRDLPVARARLKQIRSGQPHPLPAGPFGGGQPAAIGISHDPGVAHHAPVNQSW
jgi:hypothetical protein